MELIKPDYVFETSWEVCNMVGGIYTVLSTRAATLEKTLHDNLIFIGPDVWKGNSSPYFEQDDSLLAGWREKFTADTGMSLKAGRWKVHGNPVALLVDFAPLFSRKNEIYTHIWEKFGVDSIAAYGDYDEASMFGYSTGIVIEHYYRHFDLSKKKVIVHFNEWMTTFGEFYIRERVPEIAAVFTTHATSIGRSIAGNHKPLYNYLNEYNGDQMAFELNMVSKHSTEKTAAHVADCFTTVSKITGLECEKLLEKKPDIITPNGFEDDFVPAGVEFTAKREAAKTKLREVAEALLGYKLKKDAVFICTAGRYEYKNKGIDTFIESLKALSMTKGLKKEVVGFIMVPAHIIGARKELVDRLYNDFDNGDYWNRHTTHELYDYQYDNIISAFQWFHFTNQENEKVKVIFAPSYLNGNDGIFNMKYWDLLIGMDVSVFPSYYEPWGYTPLESVAFSVPTITTDLSGFGQWVKDNFSTKRGAEVVHRADYNQAEVAKEIGEILFNILCLPSKEIKKSRDEAFQISKKALWDEFIQYYFEAYDIALKNQRRRMKNTE